MAREAREREREREARRRKEKVGWWSGGQLIPLSPPMPAIEDFCEIPFRYSRPSHKK